MKAFTSDGVYVMQLITKENGTKSAALVCSPVELLDEFDSQRLEDDDYYVDILMDVKYAAELADKEEKPSTANIILNVPLISVKTFRLWLNNVKEKENEAS